MRVRQQTNFVFVLASTAVQNDGQKFSHMIVLNPTKVIKASHYQRYHIVASLVLCVPTSKHLSWSLSNICYSKNVCGKLRKIEGVCWLLQPKVSQAQIRIHSKTMQ